jgi:hypothetical protein
MVSEAPQWLPLAPEEPRQMDQQQRDGVGPLVVVLSASLFLMGCAYAAFAGYLLSVRPAVAYCAVAASISSLLTAGLGISLAGSADYRRYSGRVLGTAMIALTVFYGVLVAAVI